MIRSFGGSGASAVKLKIQKRKRKKTQLKILHLKPNLKKQYSCSPNTFYLHKLHHSTGLLFLWRREGKSEQGEGLALVGERKRVPCGVPIYSAVDRSECMLKRQDKHLTQVQLHLSAFSSLSAWRRLRTAVLFQAQLCQEVSTPATCHCASHEATDTLCWPTDCISSL